MKCFSVISVFLLVAASSHAQEAPKVDENCDRILDHMVDGCKSIRNSLLNPSSAEPKVVCCGNFRYNICVQSVKGYATVARATRICPEQIYASKINELESSLAMSAVKSVCEKFETQSCITEPVSNAWNSVKTNVQSTVNSNIDIDRLGEQIGKNWNSAMSSLTNFAKGVQDSIAQQNIPGRLQEGASALQSTIAERTKQLTDMVAGQGQNRYSVVGNEAKDDTLSLDSLVHSVMPEVEIVPAGSEKAQDAAKTPAAQGKRFSFSNWLGSLTPSFNFNSPNQDQNQVKANEIEQRGNPYSVV